MTSILLITQIVLVVLLTIAVLLQKSSSIGLGAYSGSNESVFGAKGPGSFLAKTTFLLAFLFVVNTITLGYMYGQVSNESVVDSLVDKADVAAPVAEMPVAAEQMPAAPQAPAAAEPEATVPQTSAAAEANSSN